MRMVLILASAAALAACASTGETPNTGSASYQTLYKDCTDRGGILKRIPGSNSPDDAANYACEFAGTRPKPAG